MPLLIALGANVVLMSQRKGKAVSRELPLETCTPATART
jgi:xanthine dehydrogenase iron-sulfur cluster and FAD-binding subunit A